MTLPPHIEAAVRELGVAPPPPAPVVVTRQFVGVWYRGEDDIPH